VNSSAESGKEHDVFLSHTGVDKEWVRTLGERLEQEGIDEQKGSRRIKVSLMNGVHGSAESVGRKMARQMSVTSSGRTMKRSGCARRSGR